METIEQIFGHRESLNTFQMCCRAFVLFFITLLFIRLAGMRSFAGKTAFDTSIVILLGAILSRAVTGASPAIPTIMSGLVLCLTYRLLGFLSVFNSRLSHFIKGNEVVLYENGKMNEKNMRMCNISEGDLMVGIRSASHTDSLSEIKKVIMERNGSISVIKK